VTDFIDKQNQIFEELQKLFKNNRSNLLKTQKLLEKSFEEIFDLHSDNKDYKLTAKGDFSVNPTKYYQLKSRVKTLHSFKEKLYRKNLGLQISSKHSLSLANFSTNHTEIKNTIYLLDDMIGIRVVTELKNDCNNAYKLIKDKNQFFIDKGIVFNAEELEKQPETMKNGLPIFRIKGIYKNKYGFELQIKSKIDEAWGDMDHSLFYKDYSISPIKNTVQVTMNNVGYLLEKIEDLLLGLRNSENNYKEKKEEIDFLHELSGSVFEGIKTKLGDNYDLSNIASSIKYIKDKTKVKQSKSQVKNLSFTFLNYEAKNQLSTIYLQNRNLNFELLIFESLYWYWKKKSDTKFRLTKENYNSKSTEFIEILMDNLVINTTNILKVDFLSITKAFISEIIRKYSSAVRIKSLFLDPKTIYKLKIIDTFLIDAMNEYLEESEDFAENNISNELRDIYFSLFLNLDISDCIASIKKNHPRVFEESLLNKFAFDLSEIIKRQLNNYKLQDNEKIVKEVRFIEDLLKSTLESIKLL